MLLSSVCPVSGIYGFVLPYGYCPSLLVGELFLSVAYPIGGIGSGGTFRVSF